MWLTISCMALGSCQRAAMVLRSAGRRLSDDRGDLSAYLAQGVLALAAISLTGVVLTVFTVVGEVHTSAQGPREEYPRCCLGNRVSTSAGTRQWLTSWSAPSA